MTKKIAQSFVVTVIAAMAAFHQRSEGKSWWFWALISALFLPVLVDGIEEYSKSKGGTGLHKLNRSILLSAALFIAGVAVADGYRGSSWVFPVFLSLILVFFAWTAGLPDPPPSQLEPKFDLNTPPQIPFEEALFTGSDADFSYYVNENFPYTDWKDMAEETLELFLPHLPGLRFVVRRDVKQTDITLTLGGKTETLVLEISPETAQLIELLADFLAPEYILCSYDFTEGSDTWVNPIFPAALWDRLQQERPDRAVRFTPYIKHKTLSKGPARAIT